MRLVIEKIMKHPSLQARPPVLVDIGASGYIHEKWKPLSKHSIFIAFDADKRDFNISESKSKDWHKLSLINRVWLKTVSSKTLFL